MLTPLSMRPSLALGEWPLCRRRGGPPEPEGAGAGGAAAHQRLHRVGQQHGVLQG